MPYPSKWGGLNQGLLQGMQMGQVMSQNKEAQKQRELETAIMKKKMIEEQLADSSIDNNKEYKAGLTKQWNDLNQQIFPGAPMHDGNWDKGDSKVYKNLVNVQKFIEKNNITDRETITKLMNEAYTPADDPKLKSTESKALIEGLSRRNEGFASTTLNKIDTGEAVSGDAGAPTYTGAIDTAKAIMPYLDTEGKKRLKEEFDRLGGSYANALAGDFASQPEGSWQREAIQKEATTSPYSDPKEFREAQKSKIAEERADFKPSKPDGRDPNTGKAVYFDSNIGSYRETGSKRVVNIEEALLPLSAKPIPSDKAKNLTLGLGVMDAISKVRKMVDSEVAKLTGPIQGRVNTALSKVKNTTEFKNLKWQISAMKQFIYPITGAALNETEQKWLEDEILPNINDPKENFYTALTNFGSMAGQKMRDDFGSLEGMYYVPKHLKDRMKKSTLFMDEAPASTPTPSGSKKMTFNPATGAFE